MMVSSPFLSFLLSREDLPEWSPLCSLIWDDRAPSEESRVPSLVSTSGTHVKRIGERVENWTTKEWERLLEGVPGRDPTNEWAEGYLVLGWGHEKWNLKELKSRAPLVIPGSKTAIDFSVSIFLNLFFGPNRKREVLITGMRRILWRSHWIYRGVVNSEAWMQAECTPLDEFSNQDIHPY